MSPAFTDDDIGKSVETANGDLLGVVADVDPETAYVEPARNVSDSTRAVLEWERDPSEAVPLTDDAVDRVTDDAIRLEPDFPAESVTTGSTAGDADTDADAADADRQEVDYAPGEPVASNPTEPASDIDASGGGTRDVEDAEPMMEDDEFYDAAEGGARVDPDEEMEAPDDVDESAETGELDAPDGTDDSRSDVDVDPDEVTEGDPDAEITSEEDVGRRREPGDDRDD